MDVQIDLSEAMCDYVNHTQVVHNRVQCQALLVKQCNGKGTVLPVSTSATQKNSSQRQ
jgi:hypothetical protein